MNAHRIDIHTHLIPPFWAEELKSHGADPSGWGSLHSNFDGVYLGDPAFEPIWAELDRRAAVVFVHPTTSPNIKVLKGQPSPLEDYPADTTKGAVDLVAAGVITRFPSVKIVLSHGGGFLPYAATRFAELLHSLVPDRSADTLLAEMKSFYFDTALTAPSGLPSLLAFAKSGRIFFGTDYPYASEKVSKTFTKNLDAYEHFRADEFVAINRGAGALFSRLRSSDDQGV